jgi:hypothetical protein
MYQKCNIYFIEKKKLYFEINDIGKKSIKNNAEKMEYIIEYWIKKRENINYQIDK